MLSKHTISTQVTSINMKDAFNYIISIFIHLYSITGSIALIFMFASLHILTDIPTPLQYFQISHDMHTHYICNRYECEINNTYTEQNNWEYLATYILFHLLAATVIPFTAKYIADNIANYVIQRITNIFTRITISSFPQQHLQIEDIHDEEDIEEQHDFITDYEHTPITFFPNHMSGHIQPVRQQYIHQQQSFGRLVSRRNTHTPHTNSMIQNTTRNTIMSRVINMSILAALFAHTNHLESDNENQTHTGSTGISTRIDTTYVDTSIKSFAGDACPICMTKFHILEINKKTLAAITPCKHLFCHTCIEEYVNNHSMAQVPCPLCRDIVEELYINK